MSCAVSGDASGVQNTWTQHWEYRVIGSGPKGYGKIGVPGW